jgi:chromate transport protein ChrA
VDAVGVLEIFLLMLLSALFSFGGGSGVIPLIQGRWVENGQLAPELFSFSLSITIAGLVASAAWGTARPLDLTVLEVLSVTVVAVVVAWRDVEPLKVVLGALAVGLLWSAVAA